MNSIAKTGIGILTAGAIVGGTVLVTNIPTEKSIDTEQVSEID